MSDLTLCFVLGTRPEIIKLSPIIRGCERRSIDFSIVHTGQHYSEGLDSVFFDQLSLPTPDSNLKVGSHLQGRQTAEMIAAIEFELLERRPNIVVVQGDTNSVLAGSIATCKLSNIDLAHVEAGLRSYDREMVEEINRRIADHVADYLFAPTEASRQNLLDESLPPNRVTVTGNTIVDAVQKHIEIARERHDVLRELELEGPFALLTAHREENVDDKSRFASLLRGVAEAAQAHDLQVIYPVHPRAEKRISELQIDVPGRINLIGPLDFFDFLVMEDEATVVFTDSGGVQEECCILHTPCVTLRDNTERPETVQVGANRVVGVESNSIVEGVKLMLAGNLDWENPFGDGRAADRIIEILIDHDNK